MERSAIVVEDDANTALALTKAISSMGFSVRVASTLTEARALYHSECPDLVLLDVSLPDGDGLDLMRETSAGDGSQFVVVTGDPEQDVAVRSLRARALDFLVKPISLADLRRAIGQYSTPYAANDEFGVNADASDEAAHLDESTIPQDWVVRGDLLLAGGSQGVQSLRSSIEQLASTNTNVMVTGEAGVDKNAAAYALHETTPNRGAFAHIQCATGHVHLGRKNWVNGFSECLDLAFNRLASQDTITLVLDDIEQLNQTRQRELLAYLSSLSLTDARLGSRPRLVSILRRYESVSASAGAAPHLENLLPDLSLWLCQSQLELPALRYRHEDVVAIARKVLAAFNQAERTNRVLNVDDAQVLEQYGWPGNVRELINVVTEAFNKADYTLKIDEILTAPSASEVMSRSVEAIVGKTFWEVEKSLLQATLRAHNGNKKIASQTLGISLKTLYNRLNAYSIDY